MAKQAIQIQRRRVDDFIRMAGIIA
jgi:hypothetical protein